MKVSGELATWVYSLEKNYRFALSIIGKMQIPWYAGPAARSLSE